MKIPLYILEQFTMQISPLDIISDQLHLHASVRRSAATAAAAQSTADSSLRTVATCGGKFEEASRALTGLANRQRRRRELQDACRQEHRVRSVESPLASRQAMAGALAAAAGKSTPAAQWALLKNGAVS